MIKSLIRDFYSIDCESITKAAQGAGSDTYFISGKNGSFVLKYPSQSAINHPEREGELCAYLESCGITVSHFLKNKNGEYLSRDEYGRAFHLQRFVEGRVYDLNTAPAWLMRQSAATLGKIHAALGDYKGLPIGIGENFLRI